MQNAKICLAPLRFGAGLKGKLIDAMQNGTPCVMTTIAAEGMFGNSQPNGFITDSPEDFANKAVKLYESKLDWKTYQNNGFAIINKRFQKAEFFEYLYSKIDTISQNLSSHRRNNFTGQLLQHHTLQSTKFMSKWIEAKNQKE